MCRWVVYKGRRICLADIITRPKHSLVKMSFDHYLPHIESNWNLSKLSSAKQRNPDVNADGFGIGWYDRTIDSDPCVFTSTTPAEHNRNLQRLATKIYSPLIFAHVRAASPGSPVVETNCHPFQFGRFMFMHNGGVANFAKIKRQLLSRLSLTAYSLIQGTTDSEHAGALFIDCLPGQNIHGDYSADQIKTALRDTISVLVHLSKEVEPDTTTTHNHVASSLNFAVSDGKTVVATRFRDHEEEHPPSLYYCLASDISFNNNEVLIHGCACDSTPPQAVIVGSEPLTYDEKCWKLIPRNSMMTVYEDNTVQLEDITVNPDAHTLNLLKAWKKRALEKDVVGKPLMMSSDILEPPSKRAKLEELIMDNVMPSSASTPASPPAHPLATEIHSGTITMTASHQQN